MSGSKPRIYKRGEVKTELSDGEKACLHLVLKGFSSKEIAAQLNVSPHTVDARIKTTMAYFQADSRMDAAKRLSALEISQNSERLVYQMGPRLVHQTPDIATIDTLTSEECNASRGEEGQSHVGHITRKEAQLSDASATYVPYPQEDRVISHSIRKDRAKPWQNHNTFSVMQRILAMLAIAGLAIMAFGFFVNSIGTLSRLLAS